MSPSEVMQPAPRVRWWSAWSLRRVLMVALPSFTVLLALALYAFPRIFPSQERLIARHNHRGDVKLKAGDFAGAKAEFEKVVAIAPNRPESNYRLALACMAAGENDRGLGIMKELAPLQGEGYPLAYLWLGRRVLETPQKSADANKQRVQLAELYLRRVVELEPRMVGPTVDAEMLLGEMYAVTGHMPEAQKALTAVADQRPEALLMLAEVCKAQDKTDVAKEWAQKALDTHRIAVTKTPDNHVSRARWAAAEAFLDHFEAAETILTDGLARSPGEPVLTKALGDLGAVWFDALRSVPGEGGAVRVSVLERCLKVDPTYRPLLLRVIRAIKRKGTEADRYRALLAQIRESGKASAFVYQISGEDAWERGDQDEARRHWDEAYKLAPDDMEIANNLAWVLAFGPKPDLPRAIELMNKAVESSPDRASFRDTRGLILLKAKRWKDAEPDLIMATRSQLDRPELHLALAEVYDHINQPEIAEVQRNVAKKAKGPAPAPKRTQ